jgi:hypothetical protein
MVKITHLSPLTSSTGCRDAGYRQLFPHASFENHGIASNCGSQRTEHFGGKQTFLSGRHFMLLGFFWNYGALDLIFTESGDIE